MTREMNFTIREKDADKTLTAFMVARFTYHTEVEWARLIAEGRVRVNGYATVPEVLLRTDDVVRYDASDIPEPPVDETFRVVSDDPLLLVVDKSGNLPCHPGGRYFNHTLWALLKTRCGLADPILVNRIDRETSGLVMIGKTPEAAQNLWKQFVAHKVSKQYTVFVEGEFPERLEAAGWLSADPASVIRKKRRFTQAEAVSAPPDKESEWAETLFERVRVCNGFSVVNARPRTGRLHQIRATLLSLGHPVVGDKLYGLDERWFIKFCEDSLTPEDWSLLRMRRQALHAGSLKFIHPRFGAPTELTTPLPADMAALLT
jgi:23S rRNA pseudouridine955/2504/2580 synthase/23S rRNA pseudouridine1911/1915/1917 synthase